MNHNLELLISTLKQENICGYIIPSYDEYLSEYVSDNKNRLKFITNFTGSNGLAIILTKTKSLFFTDGRYLLQARKELSSQFFEIYDINIFTKLDWSKYFNIKTEYLYIDPRCCNERIISLFQKVSIQFLAQDLITSHLKKLYSIKSPKEIFEYSEHYAGASYKYKLDKLKKYIKQKHFNNILLTNSENISWLLNLRAWDLEFTPTMLSSLLLKGNEIYLFLDENLYASQQLKEKRSDIRFEHMSQLEIILNKLDKPLLYDKDSNYKILQFVSKNTNNIAITDPVFAWKINKQDSEVKNAILVNRIDSVAICEFLAFVEEQMNIQEIAQYSEYDLITQLNLIRASNSKFIKNSFFPICAFGPNSSVIHYRAPKENSLKINNSGLLLIDSGGQYLGGTTDLTRTILIGKSLNKYSYFYTKVLKSHIAISTLIFPKSKITGTHIDSFARREIWKDFQDFPHSTGHGVGNFLNVHEPPLAISTSRENNIFFEKNMILSNEPGIYFNNDFGIRIENLILTKTTINKDFLEFQNLTLVPYDKKLIQIDLLTKQELEYIDLYYQSIMNYVYPELSHKAKQWLKSQIQFH